MGVDETTGPQEVKAVRVKEADGEETIQKIFCSHSWPGDFPYCSPNKVERARMIPIPAQRTAQRADKGKRLQTGKRLVKGKNGEVKIVNVIAVIDLTED